MLIENMIKDLTILSIIYWNDSLRTKILDIMGERILEPQYKPAETKVIISTSKQAQYDFIKCFTALNIN